MAGIDLLRNNLQQKYVAQGMSEEQALMRADTESQTQDVSSTISPSLDRAQKGIPAPSWAELMKQKVLRYFNGLRQNQSDQQLLGQGYTLSDIMKFRGGHGLNKTMQSIPKYTSSADNLTPMAPIGK
jgi:hypothetical protein